MSSPQPSVGDALKSAGIRIFSHRRGGQPDRQRLRHKRRSMSAIATILPSCATIRIEFCLKPFLSRIADVWTQRSAAACTSRTGRSAASSWRLSISASCKLLRRARCRSARQRHLVGWSGVARARPLSASDGLLGQARPVISSVDCRRTAVSTIQSVSPLDGVERIVGFRRSATSARSRWRCDQRVLRTGIAICGLAASAPRLDRSSSCC